MNIITNDEEYKIIRMYKNGICVDDMMSELHCEERYIRTVLKENSVDRRYNFFSHELYERIIFLYQKGFSLKRICNDLIVTETGISHTLKRNGIQKRSYSENNRKYSLDEHYFDSIDCQNKAYLLGLLYADGCNHIEHHSVTLTLQESDLSVVEFMKEELNYGGPIRFNELTKKNPNHKNQYILCINSEYLSQKLCELGVINAKSLVLTFPRWLDRSLYSSFVRGYFDGDGCVYYDTKRNKCQTQTVGTRDMCDNISKILHEFGCKNNIKHPKICNPNTFIVSTCGNKSSLAFLSWMYDNADFYMERKYQKYLYFKEQYLSESIT